MLRNFETVSKFQNVQVVSRKSHAGLTSRLVSILGESVYYEEVAAGFGRLQGEARDLAATLKHYGVPLPSDLSLNSSSSSGFFSLGQIESLTSEETERSLQRTLKKPKVVETLLERRRSVYNLWQSTTTEFSQLNVM
jgi:hypothetical protein